MEEAGPLEPMDLALRREDPARRRALFVLRHALRYRIELAGEMTRRRMTLADRVHLGALVHATTAKIGVGATRVECAAAGKEDRRRRLALDPREALVLGADIQTGQ